MLIFLSQQHLSEVHVFYTKKFFQMLQRDS